MSVCLVCGCLSVYEQCRSVCVHCPTVSAENEKTPAWRIGASCQKTREKSVVGEKKNKQTQAAPRYIYSDSPASLKLLVGDFKMAPPLPATEWVLPCQNVFKCKIQTQKFPTFPPSLSSLLFFSHFSLPHSLFLCLFLSPPCFCPSFIAHRKGHLILLGGALIECCLCSGKNTLFLSLAGALPELPVSVRYLPVTQKSIFH